MIALCDNFKLIQTIIATGSDRKETLLCVCVCVCVKGACVLKKNKRYFMENRIASVRLCIGKNTHHSESIDSAFMFCTFGVLSKKIFYFSQNILCFLLKPSQFLKLTFALSMRQKPMFIPPPNVLVESIKNSPLNIIKTLLLNTAYSPFLFFFSGSQFPALVLLNS